MFKLIGGINTAGKTMYLEDLYLSDAASYNFIGYDNDRIRNSETCRELPVVEASDNRVLVILDLLCRCDRNILVDEIDSYVHPADRHVVYSFLKDISKEVDAILDVPVLKQRLLEIDSQILLDRVPTWYVK